ncbi:MAG TPA: phosphonoacetaldehyde reductase [Bacillota bacterium]
MEFLPFCNTEILFASIDKMKERLLGFDARNIVLILTESAAKRWDLQNFMNDLFTRYDITWLNQSAVNPTQADILAALEKIGKKPVELIIAFGGGSAIDLAKGISAFYNAGTSYSLEAITQGIKNKSYKNNKRFIDIVAVPSTAGTGSEVTQWATIWDAGKSAKYSIDAPQLKPKLALIVPELTLTLPAKLTLATGLDALSHAIEAYWSKHTNPLVQELAYRAVELIVNNLKLGVQKQNDFEIREMLCRASVLAGLAFSQTRTTACHSISYPLTMLYDIPHGFAAAITLNAVIMINKGHFPNDSRLLELFKKYGGILNWIDMVCNGVVKMRLSAFGITKADLPVIVGKAFTGGRMNNNPVELTENDVAGILGGLL